MERGFEKVRNRGDWLKPRNNPPKGWRSKVDWELVARIDPNSQRSELLQIRLVEDEMRGEIDRDAMLLKSRNKLAQNQSGSEAKDPLNL